MLPGAATSPRASQGLRDDRVGGAGAVSQGGNILPKIQEDNKKAFWAEIMEIIFFKLNVPSYPVHNEL